MINLGEVADGVLVSAIGATSRVLLRLLTGSRVSPQSVAVVPEATADARPLLA